MQRVLARLGVSNKSPAEVEAAVNAVANGDDRVNAAAPIQPASTQRPQAALNVFPAGLPPGWQRVDNPTKAGNRLIPCYHGPDGVQTRSRVKVWRLHGATNSGRTPSSSPPVAVQRPSGAGQRGAAGKKPTSRGGPEQRPSAAGSSGSGHSRPLPADRGSSRKKRVPPDGAPPVGVTPDGAPPVGGTDQSNPFPSDFFELSKGVCGTYGCRFLNGHLGPCSTMLSPPKRQRPASYAGMDK